MSNQKPLELIDKLRIRIRNTHQVKEGVEAWRSIVNFESKNVEGKWLVSKFGPHKQYLEYYVWVTAEYLEDHTDHPPTVEGVEKFSLQHVKARFNGTVDSNERRNLERITEDRVACQTGKCRLSENLILK